MSTATRWQEIELGRVAEIERNVLPPERIPTGTVYVGMEHIDSEGSINAARAVHAGELRSAKFAFSERHVLYGKLRPYLRKTARPTFSGVCSTDILPILPGPDLDRDYLFYCLRQSHFVSLAAARSHGANLPRLSPSELAQFKVPLPPVTEQRRVVTILDKAATIRRKRHNSLGLLDDLLRSAYEHIAGGDNPARHDWPEHRVADLAAPGPDSLRTGPFGSALRHSEFVPSGVAVLGIDNAVQNHFAWAERRHITAAKYEKLKRYSVKAGDVIVTIMGTTGRSAVVPEDIPPAITTKHLAAITVDRAKVIPVFLSHALHSDRSVLTQIASANRGAIMSGLNLGIIKRLRLRVPPLSIQHQFAQLVVEVTRVNERLLSASGAADALFESLAYELLRGAA